jgi:hypothetical protein
VTHIPSKLHFEDSIVDSVTSHEDSATAKTAALSLTVDSVEGENDESIATAGGSAASLDPAPAGEPSSVFEAAPADNVNPAKMTFQPLESVEIESVVMELMSDLIELAVSNGQSTVTDVLAQSPVDHVAITSDTSSVERDGNKVTTNDTDVGVEVVSTVSAPGNVRDEGGIEDGESDSSDDELEYLASQGTITTLTPVGTLTSEEYQDDVMLQRGDNGSPVVIDYVEDVENAYDNAKSEGTLDSTVKKHVTHKKKRGKDVAETLIDHDSSGQGTVQARAVNADVQLVQAGDKLLYTCRCQEVSCAVLFLSAVSEYLIQ